MFSAMQFCLHAENSQKIFSSDSDAYRGIRLLLIEEGFAPPSATGPFSADELKKMLKKVPFDTLSQPGKDLYQRIEEELEPDPIYVEDGRFQFSLRPELSMEIYLNSNQGYTTQDWDVTRYLVSELAGGELHRWEYEYADRKPIFNLPLEGWFGEKFYSRVDLGLKKDRMTVLYDQTHYSNLSTDINSYDFQFPFVAYMSYGGENWNLQFGRDKLSWGSGRTGNLILSDYPDYHEFVRYTTYWRGWKWSSAFINLDPTLANGLGKKPELDTDIPAEDDPPYDMYKAIMAHKLEFRFRDKLNVILSEISTVGGKYIELKHLNSIMVFHNWFTPDIANSAITIELEYSPIRHIFIFGQFMIDQVQTASELAQGYGNKEPQAYAYMAGIDIVYPQWNGFLAANFEWVYTDAWMYIHKHPHTSLTYRRLIQSEYLNIKTLVDKPFGHPLGPDGILFDLDLKYTVPYRYTVGLNGSLILKGENSVARLIPGYHTQYDEEITSEDFWRKTPSGVEEIKTVLEFYGEVYPWKGMGIELHLYYIDVKNVKHQQDADESDFQSVVSMIYKF